MPTPSLAFLSRFCLMPLLCIAAKHYIHDSSPTMDSPSPRRLGSRQGIIARHGDETKTSPNNLRRKHPPTTHDPCPKECRCRFFLWDFVSYYKYHETISLAQQNIFEGKGGKKFVRLQPNTNLEKWYPQLRQGLLKTDGCLLCGHSYNDHLQFWWNRRRKKGDVSEFDRCMTKGVADRDFKGNSFHKRYVQEVDEMSANSMRRRGLEIRKSIGTGVLFMVPRFDPLADGHTKTIGSVLLLFLARIQSLVRLEDLMWLSKVESFHSEKKL